jgi:hypothetical protein
MNTTSAANMIYRQVFCSTTAQAKLTVTMKHNRSKPSITITMLLTPSLTILIPIPTTSFPLLYKPSVQIIFTPVTLIRIPQLRILRTGTKQPLPMLIRILYHMPTVHLA